MTEVLRLKDWGVEALTPDESQHVEGGFLPFLIVGAAVLLSGCGNTIIYNYGNNNAVTGQASADSSGNGAASGSNFP